LAPQAKDTILDNMKGAGVRVIRAGIVDNHESLDFIQRVYAHGIKIEGLAGVRGPSGNMILSVADPNKERLRIAIEMQIRRRASATRWAYWRTSMTWPTL
jgi:hypothetical protein